MADSGTTYLGGGSGFFSSVGLLLSFFTLQTAAAGIPRADHYVNELAFDNGVVLPFGPTLSFPDVRELAIVRASQVSRKVTRWSRQPGEQPRPRAVELEYRVTAVYCGNEEVIGKVFGSHAGPPSTGSSSSSWNIFVSPEEADDGVWLVVYHKLKQAAVLYRASAVGIPFPVFESNAADGFSGPRPTFEEVEHLGESIAEYVELGIGSLEGKEHLMRLVKERSLASPWAIWQLQASGTPPSPVVLRQVCQGADQPPMAQFLADYSLLHSPARDEWKSSAERKQMISRWLADSNDEFNGARKDLLFRLFDHWASVGYDDETLREQLQAAYDAAKPFSSKRRLLRKRFPNIHFH